MPIKFLRYLLGVAGIFVISGCVSKLTPPGVYTLQPSNVQQSISNSTDGGSYQYSDRPYRLEVGDVVDFKVRSNPEWDRVQRVHPDGRIRIPFLGEIQVLGRTLDQVQTLAREKYSTLTSSVPEPKDRSYLIQAGDQLEVKFYENEQFNNTVLVRPDGKISLLLVNSIIAEGKTPEELQYQLTKLYSKHVVDPKLVVIVRQNSTDAFYFNGKRSRPYTHDLETATFSLQSTLPPKIYIGGEVATPGVLDLVNHTTVLRAIMSTGGYLYTANLENIIIMRRDFTQEGDAVAKYIVVDLTSDIAGNSSSDIPLEPFDIVIVPKTALASVRSFVDEYVYRIAPQLRNVSVGFSFTKQVGVDKIESTNTVK